MGSISFWYDDIGNLPPPSLLTNVDSVCQVPSLKLAVEFKQLLMECGEFCVNIVDNHLVCRIYCKMSHWNF